MLKNPEISQVYANIRQFIYDGFEKLLNAEMSLDGTEKRYNTETDPGVNHTIESCKNKTMGSFMNVIGQYEKVATDMSAFIPQISANVTICTANIEDEVCQVLIKQLEILAIRVKHLIAEIGLKVAQMTKGILEGFLNGKAAGIMAPLVLPVITAYQVISTILTAAMTAIELVIKLFPDPITVPAESMAFFMTPKSMQKTDIKAINTNMSMVDRLPEPVKVAIREAINAVNVLNVPIKIAIVAICAAAGKAAAESDSYDFEIKGCECLHLLDAQKIIKAVEFIVSLLPIPMGLPKYEKLSIINLGFDAWLMTSFNLAGKQSFGMPGQP